MKKRKLVAMALALCFLVTATVYTTIAYFSDSEVKTNVFTFGEVDITLTEKSEEVVDPDTGATIVYPGTPVDPEKQEGPYTFDEVLPGRTYSKIPTVAVEEKSADCYVAIVVTVPQEIVGEGFLGGVDTVNFTTERRVNSDDGTYSFVFYCNSVLKGGDTLTPFKTVTISTALTSEEAADLGGKADVVVTAYAVQADGFTSVGAAMSNVYGTELSALGNVG